MIRATTAIVGTLLIALPALVPAVPATYDPLARGPKPTVTDRDLALPGGRTVPVRIFLPAEATPAPVLLFSHGLGGSREGSNYLGNHWSSRGYVTIFVQHPGSDSAVWMGQGVRDATAALKDAASVAQYLQRIRDITGTLDVLENLHARAGDPLHGRLLPDRCGLSGHSFGAKTTQAVAGEQGGGPRISRSFADPRIKAALPMSPSPARLADPSFSFGKVDRPWLLMTGTRDAAPRFLVSTTPADRLKVYPALPPGDKYELVLFDAEHSAFTDRRLPGEAAPRNPNHHRAILALSTAFWDAYLRNDPAARAWLRNDARSVLEPGDSWQMK